jgi:hypothetical protein
MECRWCGERFDAREALAVHELDHQIRDDERFWAQVRALAERSAG